MDAREQWVITRRPSGASLRRASRDSRGTGSHCGSAVGRSGTFALGRHRADWGANFVVTVSFVALLAGIGGDAALFPTGLLALVALTYFHRQVRETKTRSPPLVMGIS